MSGKKFPIRKDSFKRAGIREMVQKTMKLNEIRIKVTFGVDSEFKILEPCVIKDNIFIPCGVQANKSGVTLKDYLAELKDKGKSIYYTLDTLTYLCTVTIRYNGNGIIEKRVNIYIPIDTDEENNSIICKDVSIMFGNSLRSILVDAYMEYVKFKEPKEG